MYQFNSYWERLDLHNVCSYLRDGVPPSEDNPGTPGERDLRYNQRLLDELVMFRDSVLEYDWDSVDNEDKKEVITEDMWQEIILTVSDMRLLDYEMGFYAAMKIILNKNIEPQDLSQFNLCDR